MPSTNYANKTDAYKSEPSASAIATIWAYYCGGHLTRIARPLSGTKPANTKPQLLILLTIRIARMCCDLAQCVCVCGGVVLGRRIRHNKRETRARCPGTTTRHGQH